MMKMAKETFPLPLATFVSLVVGKVPILGGSLFHLVLIGTFVRLGLVALNEEYRTYVPKKFTGNSGFKNQMNEMLKVSKKERGNKTVVEVFTEMMQLALTTMAFVNIEQVCCKICVLRKNYPLLINAKKEQTVEDNKVHRYCFTALHWIVLICIDSY